MNTRLFAQFLRDRIGLIAAFLIQTGLLLALTWLIMRGSDAPATAIRTNVVYALLLSLAVIGVYMTADFFRWWPFARRVGQLLHEDTDPAGLLTLAPGGNVDQRLAHELLRKFHRLATDELLRSEAARRRHLDFINLWVHQMKTPVSAINVIAQQAESGADPADALRSIEEETAKLTEGLELVLNMARLEDFALDFHIVSVDLLQAVREAINARKKEFIRLGIFPEVEAEQGEREPGAFVVLTDVKWHRFILDQIISNALKYGAQGGEPGQRLRFRLARQDRTVRLAIADEGPGIPPEDLPRVFDAFFTGQNGRRFANATGIGLFLVRQVADKLGHRLTVESEVGRGTTVRILYNDAIE